MSEQEIKEETKNKAKKKVKRKAIKVLIPIIAVILIAGMLYAVFYAIADTIRNIRETISEFIDKEVVNDGAIIIDDDYIDTVITNLEAIGVDLTDLYLMGDVDYDKDSEEYKEILRDYLRGFMQAEEVTQTIHIDRSVDAGILNKRCTFGLNIYV